MRQAHAIHPTPRSESPPGAVQLLDQHGASHRLDALTTLFDLLLVVLDLRQPAQVEAMLPVAARIDRVMSGADATVGVLLIGGTPRQATAALGELARETAVFVDPDGRASAALGLRGTPALLWVTPEPAVRGLAEGWEPAAWRALLDRAARKLWWTRPLLPAPGDPPPAPPVPLEPVARSADRAHDPEEVMDDVPLAA